MISTSSSFEKSTLGVTSISWNSPKSCLTTFETVPIISPFGKIPPRPEDTTNLIFPHMSENPGSVSFRIVPAYGIDYCLKKLLARGILFVNQRPKPDKHVSLGLLQNNALVEISLISSIVASSALRKVFWLEYCRSFKISSTVNISAGK